MTSGKTIKQIADELGVSKTAVRKKMTDEIKNQFSETIGNTVYISEQGEDLIKSAFLKTNENQVSDNQSETVCTLVSMLQKELDIKNKQIEVQAATIESLTTALAAAQALHAGTIQQLKLVDNKKHYWWQFWKNKND
jgi:predicted ArsR family transcriptional regulator